MTTKQLERIYKRAENGAEYLDKNHKGWWRKIRTTSLDMADGSVCIIGQLTGGYHPEQIGVHSATRQFELGFEKAGRYGRIPSHEYYEALDEAWKIEVRARRRARA